MKELTEQQQKELDILYRQQHKYIRSLCYKYSDYFIDESVDDLVQVCFERICRYWPQYDNDKGSIRTWINMLCKAALHNLLRDKYADKRSIDQDTSSLEALLDKFNCTR